MGSVSVLLMIAWLTMGGQESQGDQYEIPKKETPATQASPFCPQHTHIYRQAKNGVHSPRKPGFLTQKKAEGVGQPGPSAP